MKHVSIMSKVVLFSLALMAILSFSEAKSPIILVPGYTGSRLQASLNKKFSEHQWCIKKAQNYTLWLSAFRMFPVAIQCLVDNLKMEYNVATRRTSNVEGVKIYVPGFGGTEAIEFVDPKHYLKQGRYYNNMVTFFVKNGYVRNKSVRGAPYDWRKAPNEQGPYFQKLKTLVEQTFNLNGQKKVILVGHSMGCDMLLQFLHLQDSAWKGKFVKSLVTLAGPFAGASFSISQMISGSNFGSKMIDPLTTKPMIKTFTSITSFFPNSRAWSSEKVLVETPKRNYTLRNYEQLFKDINWPTGYEMLKDTQSLISDSTVPGVEAHCLYGLGKKTVESIRYDHYFPNKSPVGATFGDGDGTVNKVSLESCQTWSKHQKEKFVRKSFANTSHSDIVKKQEVFQYILDLASQ